MPPSLLIFSTASSRKEAEKLAALLLEKKLAACVNLIPGVESRYRWKGKRERAREVLLLIKTRTGHFRSVEELIRKHHSYTVPEVIAVPLVRGSRAYLNWVAKETRAD